MIDYQDADYYVAIENGIFEVSIPSDKGSPNGHPHGPVEKRYYDAGWVLIRKGGSDVEALTMSAAIELPNDVVDEAWNQGFGFETTTVGDRLKARFPKVDKQDP